MQSMLNIHGVPLCLSGIIHPLPLSHEMADHDRRRKAIRRRRRRQRSLTRSESNIHADQEIMGGQNAINFGRGLVAVKGGETDGDLEEEDDKVLNNHDLSCTLTARAA